MLLATGSSWAIDFNGDGSADLLFRDHRYRDQRLRVLINAPGLPGTLLAARSILLSSLPANSRGLDVRTGDFNGDGRTDILSRDLVGGGTSLRMLNGTTILAQGAIANIPMSRTTPLIAAADFNGDRRGDLLFRDTLSGKWSIYLLNGVLADTLNSGTAAVSTDLQMRWVSSADFDGDGRADILLRNANTLRWYLYQMNGRVVRATTRLDALPISGNWQLQAIADLNRDRRADLLLRNRVTGA